MQLQIRSKNIRLHADNRDTMERRVQFALNRFDGQISSVIVGLEDLNGPRKGVDKQCRLVVRIPNCGKITIEETSHNALAAVALAANRAGQVVGRALQRRRRTWHCRTSIYSMSPEPEPPQSLHIETNVPSGAQQQEFA